MTQQSTTKGAAMTLEQLRSKRDEFKSMNARQQRAAIEQFYKALDRETASHVTHWTEYWASDLLGEDAEFVTCFDVWFVTTVIYDVDIPNDVVECIAEEFEAGRGKQSAQSWRNLLSRHNLPWRRWTKADLEEVGAVSLA